MFCPCLQVHIKEGVEVWLKGLEGIDHQDDVRHGVQHDQGHGEQPPSGGTCLQGINSCFHDFRYFEA